MTMQFIALCNCRCHNPDTGMHVKHIAACCCPHRFKVRDNCPQCNPPEEENDNAGWAAVDLW